MLEHDRLDDIGDVLDRVQCAFEGLDDALEPQHLEGLDLTPEEVGELLAEISKLYRMAGGSGLTFRPKEVTCPEVAR